MLRYHNPIDNSCKLEREELRPDYGEFSFALSEAMRDRPLSWLRKHYPELEFGLEEKKTKGHNYSRTRARGMHIWADWRK